VYNSKRQFSEHWAIILGGSSGFGLAAIEKLSRHGMNVAVLYRETAVTEKLLKEKFVEISAAAGVTILPFNINALEAAGRTSFIQQFSAAVGKTPCVRLLLHSIARGNLKPLINSKGANPAKTKELAGKNILSIEDLQLTTYAMATSLLDWTRTLLQEELFHPDGRIIGLTSEGVYKYWEGYAAVAIAKASL
jgi:enoyl-[acyl-carrier protein] reductase III